MSFGEDPELDDKLPYHIELWDAAGRVVERPLGDAASATLARVIFESAQREYPGRHITLRLGRRILNRSGGHGLALRPTPE